MKTEHTTCPEFALKWIEGTFRTRFNQATKPNQAQYETADLGSNGESVNHSTTEASVIGGSHFLSCQYSEIRFMAVPCTTPITKGARGEQSSHLCHSPDNATGFIEIDAVRERGSNSLKFCHFSPQIPERVPNVHIRCGENMYPTSNSKNKQRKKRESMIPNYNITSNRFQQANPNAEYSKDGLIDYGHEFLVLGTTITANVYCETLKKLRRAIQNKRRGLLSKSVILLHDNVRPHIAARTKTLLDKYTWETCEHPPTVQTWRRATTTSFPR
ncbi:hypothetical protein ANN_02678 [Periplaneta americana]|uniref:Histone-lysine N-methyltransferase SETMAR n=1 Tax=Periplaneta americana TaxID=6978 RepID=A0ABQ8TZF6_PERAM|nr:hypothetical protein ANN_02678 [Periplaneta americana]